MKDNLTEKWFKWFYKNWEKFSPGDLLDNGLLPSQIAERFVNDNQDNLIELANKFDWNNKDALEQFMKLSESELHIIKYFLKLIQLRKIK
tara:strand:+ start:471 stop:740 length:270 start_codon:yes stop_codon:yes gene_type:complete